MDQHNLSSLPNELLQEIFDDLPITDCQSIRDAHAKTTRKGDFEDVYDDRVSLHRYFTNCGLDGKQMVNILANSHTFMIGSRALEFFVPQSATSQSDWNFFMEYCPIMIYQFMKSMEKMGVVWDDLAERIYRRILEDRKDVCATPIQLRDAAKTLRERYGNFDDQATTTLEDMIEIMNDAEIRDGGNRRMVVWYDEDEMLNFDPVNNHEAHQYANSRDQLSGKITIDGEELPITLSFSNEHHNKYRLMAFLHRFPLSIMQCTITGFGAVHLYGKEACKKLSYRWEAPSFSQNHEKGPESRKAITSYLDRGFDIRYQPWTKNHLQNTRQSSDNRCIQILSPVNDDWDIDLWKEMQHQYLDIAWSEMCMDTVHIPNPDSGNLPKELSEMMYEIENTFLLKLDNEYLQFYGVI
jgi:hypothetical protein